MALQIGFIFFYLRFAVQLHPEIDPAAIACKPVIASARRSGAVAPRAIGRYTGAKLGNGRGNGEKQLVLFSESWRRHSSPAKCSLVRTMEAGLRVPWLGNAHYPG